MRRQPAQARTPRPDPMRDHLVAERDAARTHRDPGAADPYRDMSGDAVTYMRGCRELGGAESEYALSVARNLARDESLAREELDKYYIGGGDLFNGV